MTASTTPSAEIKIRATPEERRATAVGVILVVLAAFVYWVFGRGVADGVTSTFNLSLPGARFADLAWEVNSQWLAYIVAVILAFIG